MFKVIQKRKTRHDVRFDMPRIRTDRKRELLLLMCMLIGLILGIWCIKKNSEWTEKLSVLWENYTLVRAQQSPVSDYFTMLCVKLMPLICVFISGLCAVGVPFLYMIPIGYGFLYGFLGADLYAGHMLRGIGYCALILYPGAALTGAVLIYACSASIAMSGRLLKSLSANGQAESTNIRSYSICFLIILAIAAAVSVLDIALYRLFAAYFQLS